jgi:hypothetical protein
MGVPNLEVGYTSATTGRGDHEVHKGHVVALEKKSHTHSEYVIRCDFLLQQWLYGHSSMLRYTYIACLVRFSVRYVTHIFDIRTHKMFSCPV